MNGLYVQHYLEQINCYLDENKREQEKRKKEKKKITTRSVDRFIASIKRYSCFGTAVRYQLCNSRFIFFSAARCRCRRRARESIYRFFR